MDHPMPPFKGACLCGDVQVTLTQPALLTVACHCRDCQKLTASAFSLTTMFPRDGFSCSGEVIKGGLHSARRDHYFCKSCLNFIYSELAGAEWRVNLRTALLEDAAAFTPYIEVMTAQKMPWVTLPVAHSYETVPASPKELQTLMEAYAN